MKIVEHEKEKIVSTQTVVLFRLTSFNSQFLHFLQTLPLEYYTHWESTRPLLYSSSLVSFKKEYDIV